VVQRVLDTATVGPPCKLAIIAVLSREMVAHANGQQNIATLLREDAVASLDATAFSTAAAVAGVSPAGLLNGVTPITATTGGDTAAMQKDVDKLCGVIADAGGGSRVVIAATRQAWALEHHWPNDNPPTIWESAALSAGTVVAVCPDAFVSSMGEPRIEAGIETALHMEGASPAPLATGTGPVVASPIYSAFQMDLVVVRCILEIAYTMRADGMIAYLTGATWGGP
jgi:hypothetical protein